MVLQSVVVIQDACREINSKVFDWAPNGLSLKSGDKITLVAVLHQIVTPLGCKVSVDNRLAFGTNEKIIEAEVARKKEEYKKNEELSNIFKLYKSMKVGFNIEIAMGSSPKTVTFKVATKLKATWLILDRKMKNDEDYFLEKLSCGIARIRNYNRIVRIREPIDTPQQKSSQSHDTSTYLELFTVDIFSNGHENYELHHDQRQRQNISLEENKHNEKIKEKNRNKMHEHESLSTKVYHKSERYLYSGGARNFFHGGAENYTICEQFFKF